MTLVPFCGRFLPCLRAVLRGPIRSLCVAGAIFFSMLPNIFLRDLDPRVACDPTSFLCGRCNNFDASEMFSPDPIHACWEGSQVIDSDFVWPAQ